MKLHAYLNFLHTTALLQCTAISLKHYNIVLRLFNVTIGSIFVNKINMFRLNNLGRRLYIGTLFVKFKILEGRQHSGARLYY